MAALLEAKEAEDAAWDEQRKLYHLHMQEKAMLMELW